MHKLAKATAGGVIYIQQDYQITRDDKLKYNVFGENNNTQFECITDTCKLMQTISCVLDIAFLTFGKRPEKELVKRRNID